MYKLKIKLFFKNLSLFIFLIGLYGCATESHKVVTAEKVETFGTPSNKKKPTIVVGNFQNRSGYMQGLFSSGKDKLGNQAKTILKSHLQQSNRFDIFDRQSFKQNAQEAKLSGMKQNIQGARYNITGKVTEFGRKVTGDKQLFGILGSGKKQLAYAKVTINVVDVLSSKIVYSTQGAGEYSLSNREVIGFGGTASYDATLNGKVLDFAIKESVNNMVRDLEKGIWNIQN